MTNQSQPKTDIQQSVDHVNAAELANNVNDVNQQVGGDTDNNAPQPLSNEQKTPFIDESLRTDK